MVKKIFDLNENNHSIINDVTNSLLKSAFNKKKAYIDAQIEINKKKTEILQDLIKLNNVTDDVKKSLIEMNIEDNKDDIAELESKFPENFYSEEELLNE